MHAHEQAGKSIHVHTVDTDVIVILAGAFHNLIAIQPLADIWVAFGMGRKNRFYHINTICASFGEPQSRLLQYFMLFLVSAFNGKGKKSVWQAWQINKEVTETFMYLVCHPFQQLDLDDDHFQKLERLTVILYDKTSNLTCINGTRRELFCHKNKAMNKLPPTKDVLLQHVRRAVYQARIWTISTQTHMVIPSPQDFAWINVSQSWVPVWVTIPEVLVRAGSSSNVSAREIVRISNAAKLILTAHHFATASVLHRTLQTVC